jgi:hypothetical protein
MSDFIAFLLDVVRRPSGTSNNTYISQVSWVSTVITPLLRCNVTLASIPEWQFLLFLPDLHDYDTILVINILVYSPQCRTFLADIVR